VAYYRYFRFFSNGEFITKAGAYTHPLFSST